MKSLNLLIAGIQAEMQANEPSKMINDVSDNKTKIQKLITDLKGDYGSGISMIGSRTNWESDWETLHPSIDLYNIYGVNTRLSKGEKFKFKVDNNSEDYDANYFSIVHENMDNTIVTADVDYNFEVGGEADTHFVSVKLDMFNKTLTISKGYSLGIVGPFTNWGAMPDYKMTEGPYNVWTGSYDSTNVNMLKFRLNSNWDINIGANGDLNGSNILENIPGNYRYTFNVQQYIDANFNKEATYEIYKKVLKSSYVYKDNILLEYPENVYTLNEILLETTDSILITEQKPNESGNVEVLGTYGGTVSNTENVYTVSQEPITVSKSSIHKLIMDVNTQTITLVQLTSGESFNITVGETTIEFTEPDLGYFKLENAFVNEFSFTLGASLDISAFTINKHDTIIDHEAIADNYNMTFTTNRLTTYSLYININDFDVPIDDVIMLPAKSMTIELGPLYNTISLSYEVPAGILDDKTTEALFPDFIPGNPLLPVFWVWDGVLNPPRQWPNGTPVVEYIKPTSLSGGGFWTYLNVLPYSNIGIILLFNNGSILTGNVYSDIITKPAVIIKQNEDEKIGTIENYNYEVSQEDTIKTSPKLVDFSSWTVNSDNVDSVTVNETSVKFNFTETSGNSSIYLETDVNDAVTLFAVKFAITGKIGLVQMKIKQVLGDGTVANEYEAFLNQYANVDENGNGRFSLPVYNFNTPDAYCVAEILSMPPNGSTTGLDGSIEFSECVLVTRDLSEPPHYELRLGSDVLQYNDQSNGIQFYYKKVELKINKINNDIVENLGGFKLKFNKDLNTTDSHLNVFKLLNNTTAQQLDPISAGDKLAYTTAMFVLDQVTPVVSEDKKTTTITLQGTEQKYIFDKSCVPEDEFSQPLRLDHDWSQWTTILILADSDETIFDNMRIMEISQPSTNKGIVLDVELFKVHD